VVRYFTAPLDLSPAAKRSVVRYAVTSWSKKASVEVEISTGVWVIATALKSPNRTDLTPEPTAYIDGFS
jgi:hypothetical protein